MRLLLFYHGTTFVTWDAAICLFVIGALMGVWLMAVLMDADERRIARKRRPR